VGRAALGAVWVLLLTTPKLPRGSRRMVLPLMGFYAAAAWDTILAALLTDAARFFVWFGEQGVALRLIAAARRLSSFWAGEFGGKTASARPPSSDL